MSSFPRFLKGRFIFKIFFFFLFVFKKKAYQKHWQRWACFPLGNYLVQLRSSSSLQSDRICGFQLATVLTTPLCFPHCSPPHSWPPSSVLWVLGFVLCVKSWSSGRARLPPCCGSREAAGFSLCTWTLGLPCLCPCAAVTSCFRQLVWHFRGMPSPKLSSLRNAMPLTGLRAGSHFLTCSDRPC